MAKRKYKDPGPRPLADTTRLEAKVKDRFLSPEERRERVRAASLMCGIPSLTALAKLLGMYPATLTRSLDREQVPITIIYRLAAYMNVSIEFLTERELGVRRSDSGTP